MLLRCDDAEFRGLVSRSTKDGKKVYDANFEDCMSNPFKLYLGSDPGKVSELEKGCIVNLLLDYNVTYKNLNLVEVL